MEGRKQFTFYRSYYEALSRLPKNQRLKALEAVIGYALDGREPEGLNDVQSMAFLLIKPTLDAGLKKAIGGVNSGKTRRRSREDTANKGEIEKENEVEKENEIEDECQAVPGFADFWNLYPVKLGKDKALAAWNRLRPDGQAVCDGIKKWLQTKQWKQENGRFIPRAAKFLEERHYDHLPGDHIPQGASGVLGQAELEAIEKIMRG